MLKELHKNIITFHQKCYIYGLYASYILYTLLLIGTVFKVNYNNIFHINIGKNYNITPSYLLNLLKIFIGYYISIVLIWNFNPFRKLIDVNTEFNRRIIFDAGIYLLMSSTFGAFIVSYFNQELA